MLSNSFCFTRFRSYTIYLNSFFFLFRIFGHRCAKIGFKIFSEISITKFNNVSIRCYYPLLVFDYSVEEAIVLLCLCVPIEDAIAIEPIRFK